MKIIRGLDPAKHTQVLSHLLAALMSNKQALIKMQSTKIDLAPPQAILDLLSFFLLNFNPKQVDLAGT